MTGRDVDLTGEPDEVEITPGACEYAVTIGGLTLTLCVAQWFALVEAVGAAERAADDRRRADRERRERLYPPKPGRPGEGY